MTSLDAVAALFLFFFIVQFVLFFIMGWCVNRLVKALILHRKEFQRQSKFWRARARKEAFLRDLGKLEVNK